MYPSNPSSWVKSGSLPWCRRGLLMGRRLLRMTNEGNRIIDAHPMVVVRSSMRRTMNKWWTIIVFHGRQNYEKICKKISWFIMVTTYSNYMSFVLLYIDPLFHKLWVRQCDTAMWEWCPTWCSHSFEDLKIQYIICNYYYTNHSWDGYFRVI
jgi:hypothetical protein